MLQPKRFGTTPWLLGIVNILAVKTDMGGGLVEHDFATKGMEAANHVFAEAFGFDIVEVSDT